MSEFRYLGQDLVREDSTSPLTAHCTGVQFSTSSPMRKLARSRSSHPKVLSCADLDLQKGSGNLQLASISTSDTPTTHLRTPFLSQKDQPPPTIRLSLRLPRHCSTGLSVGPKRLKLLPLPRAFQFSGLVLARERGALDAGAADWCGGARSDAP